MKKIVISLEQIDWSVPCRDVWNMTAITPDKIERYSKAQRSSNSGSNWYQDKFAYYTNNYGQTWTKCNLHKTTNSGSTWNKIT